MSAIPGYFFVGHFQRDLKLVYVVLEGNRTHVSFEIHCSMLEMVEKLELLCQKIVVDVLILQYVPHLWYRSTHSARFISSNKYTASKLQMTQVMIEY